MAFPDYPLVDDFDRPDESPPMTGWADVSVGYGFSVVSDAAVQVVGGGIISYMPSLGIFGDCEARFTLTAPPIGGTNFVGLVVHLKLAPQEYYAVYILGDGAVQIIKYGTGVLDSTSVVLAANDEFGIQILASTINVYYRPVGGGAWSNILSAVDADYVSGYIGMVGGDASSAIINDFGGGGTAPVVNPTAILQRVLRLSNEVPFSN